MSRGREWGDGGEGESVGNEQREGVGRVREGVWVMSRGREWGDGGEGGSVGNEQREGVGGWG